MKVYIKSTTNIASIQAKIANKQALIEKKKAWIDKKEANIKKKLDILSKKMSPEDYNQLVSFIDRLKTPLLRVNKKGECVFVEGLLNGKQYLSYYFPLKDSNDNFITTLFMGEPLDIVSDLVVTIFVPLVIVVILVSIVLCVFIFFIV